MLRNKLDFVEDSFISDEMVLHITRGVDYAKFSPIEKFRYVDKIMKLSRDYYCNMFNIHKYKVGTYFVYGFHGGGCRLEEEGDKSSFGLTVDKVMMSDNPLDIFRTCVHEMRHVYQALILDEKNPEVKRNYAYSSDDTSSFLWYSSNSETIADKFSFEEALLFAKKCAFKFDKERVPILDLVNLKIDSMQSGVIHASSKAVYNVLEKFNVWSKKEDYADGKHLVNIFTLKTIEELASEVPEIMLQECKKGSIEDNTSEVAKEVIDLFGKYVEYLEDEQKNSNKEETKDELLAHNAKDCNIEKMTVLENKNYFQTYNFVNNLGAENNFEE